MNTVKSVYYGWGAFIGAGGLAYFLAKRSVNADRANKALDDIEWRKRQDQMRASEQEYRAYMQVKSESTRGNDSSHDDHGGAVASQEAASDPAPTRHAPATQGQKTFEKSKYEATEVFKAPKGDRFTSSFFGGNK